MGAPDGAWARRSSYVQRRSSRLADWAHGQRLARPALRLGDALLCLRNRWSPLVDFVVSASRERPGCRSACWRRGTSATPGGAAEDGFGATHAFAPAAAAGVCDG